MQPSMEGKPIAGSSFSSQKEYLLSYPGHSGVENASLESTKTDLSLNSRDVIVGEQWLVLAKVGEGSFGEVFDAQDIGTGRHYAIKRETLKMRHPQLAHESLMYDVLAGGPGIPQCHWHGQHEEFDCIVIDLLGPNLNQLRETVSKVPVDIAVQFGCQMVSILEHIHKRGLVYRDVKPDNFLFSASCHLPEPELIETQDADGAHYAYYKYPDCETIFESWGEGVPTLHVVDFGLASWWRDPKTNKPYPELRKHIRNKTGTARYASLNVHRGKVHARRDDLESVGYLLLDLVFGSLPWTGIQAKNSKAGWDRMRHMKEDTFMADFCAGLPTGLLNYIEYTRRLRFADQPDYDYMRRLLKGCLEGGEFSEPVRSPFGGSTTSGRWDQQHHPDTGPAKPNQKFAQTNRRLDPAESMTNHKRHTGRPAPDHHEDIFSMDDVKHTLPTSTHAFPVHHEKSNHLNPPPHHRSRPRRSSKDQGSRHSPQIARPSTSPPAKPGSKKLYLQKKIGWNTHKHDQVPWNPQTEWNNVSVSQPDDPNTLHWGSSDATPQWGDVKVDQSGWKENPDAFDWAQGNPRPWEQ
ncbi:kinase-like domain-containing protein [Radiomyces spectabilis]|uniref:kinase-like domain-containing protein n=1 Tax=Radiomyces spectabilis TaxID=64574 RepID=UPI00221E7C33|nr:kinase-like domain-containing protein [Radiomyces spectabilis]KAI8377683.1 kinase-like domain-containing protein [Radiomyces spectabilis]